VEANDNKNVGDVFFPNMCCLRISLESTVQGKDVTAIDFFTKLLFVPFGKRCLTKVGTFGAREWAKASWVLPP
jgi:hypothetical protein